MANGNFDRISIAKRKTFWVGPWSWVSAFLAILTLIAGVIVIANYGWVEVPIEGGVYIQKTESVINPVVWAVSISSSLTMILVAGAFRLLEKTYRRAIYNSVLMESIIQSSSANSPESTE